MSSIPAILLTTAATAVGLAHDAVAAPPLTLGLHNVKTQSYFYELPEVGFEGTAMRTELFDVIRLSPSAKNAQGYMWGDRSRKVWISSAVLSRAPATAPRGSTEVAGPGGSRVFRPAARLTCRGTNFVSVGVRDAPSSHAIVRRGGKVVPRSRTLRGPGLAVDRIRVPCGGEATLRYATTRGVRSFRVTVTGG